MEYIIRAASARDAKEFSRIYAPYVLNTAVTFEYEPPDEAEFRRRIENTLPFYPYLAAECGGKVVGYCCASRFHERAAYDYEVEVSIYLDESCRHMGLGRAFYKKMEELLTAQGFCDMFASIAVSEKPDEYLTNASPLFHRAEGFADIAEFPSTGYKFGRWYGLKWMVKHLNPHLSEMPRLLSFSEIKDRFGL